MSSKQKKVHYEERGSKPAKSHHHRSSKDSGVGSSSASDRASLGTTPNDSPFSYQQIEAQRHKLSAVQEALNAAYEKIERLEAANAKLNASLTESNKENRLLKKEKGELLNKLDDAMDDIDDQKKVIDKLKREGSPRAGATSSSTSSRASHRDEKRSSPGHRERRASWREMPVPLYDRHTTPPSAPQPPPNLAPNPFAPRAPATYPPPGPVAYSSSNLSYAPVPVFGAPPSPTRDVRQARYQEKNDGKYHLSPV